MRLGIVMVLVMLSLSGAVLVVSGAALPRAASPQQPSMAQENEELRGMFLEDQADRAVSDERQIDWAVVGPRDRLRLGRVKSMFSENLLKTASDYYHAAMILQHGDAPGDFLLAHEFCVAAMVKGRNDRNVTWLAAASEDRFLMSIKRPQRFGTQFRSYGDRPMELYEVDAAVTDELRLVMGARTLAESKALETHFKRQ